MYGSHRATHINSRGFRLKKKNCSQTSCADTSIESRHKSKELTGRLCQRIRELARKSAANGLTINEAEKVISDHKSSSVSPRFSELVRRGDLVRVLTGYSRPTKRFPRGIARYVSRYDEETRRNVTIHWLPEFAPKTELTAFSTSQDIATTRRSGDGSGESEPTQAVYL